MTHKVTFASLVVEEFANRILSALRLYGLLAACSGKILKPAWFRPVRLSLVHLNFCHSLPTGLFLLHLAVMSDDDNRSVSEHSAVESAHDGEDQPVSNRADPILLMAMGGGGSVGLEAAETATRTAGGYQTVNPSRNDSSPVSGQTLAEHF